MLSPANVVKTSQYMGM